MKTLGPARLGKHPTGQNKRLFLVAIVSVLSGFKALYPAPSRIWEELPPLKEGRSGMVAFTTSDSKPAYFGGTSWQGGVKRFHASGFVLHNGSWKSLEPLTDPIAYAAVTAKDGVIYAVGGTDGIGLRPGTLVANRSPQIVSSDTFRSQNRIYAGAAWSSGTLYLLGGSTELSPLSPTASVSKLEAGLWTNVSQLPEGALINPAVTTWKTKILVFGGGVPTANGLKNTHSVCAFEPEKSAWSKLGNLPLPIRGAVALAFPGVGIVVAGGYTGVGEFSTSVFKFDPEKNQFDSLAQLPIGLMLPAFVSNGNWLYVFGGEDAPSKRSQRAFRAFLPDLLKSRSN